MAAAVNPGRIHLKARAGNNLSFMDLSEGLSRRDREDGSIRDGFPGQRMLVVPRPRMRQALAEPSTRILLVTDCGYFPEARRHGRERLSPIPQAVIIICVKGRGWCSTPEGRFEVAPGQAVILPPHEPHAYGADPDDPWTTWWIHVEGLAVSELLASGKMTASAPVRSVTDLYAAVGLINEVIRWMERDTSSRSLVAAGGAALHLLSMLAADRSKSGGTSEGVEKAVEHLRTHFDARISVPELASMAGLSTSHFSTLFKERTGLAVLNYQTQLRMAAARELLDISTRSIEDIASAVGYDDSFYFSRQFRKIHGQSPTAYRRHDKG